MHLCRRFLPIVIAALPMLITACGEDPADPDYSDHIGLIPPENKVDEPDPFRPGEERLSVELFYEGERTKTIYVNGFRTHYFVFGRDELGRDTYQHGHSGDRMEGEQSDRIELVGTPWWGGGIIWDEPIDLSDWRTMFVAFKSSDTSFASFEITFLSGEGESPSAVTLNPADYGYTNDGEWHFLEIPLEDAVRRGLDLTRMRSPFILGAAGGTAGHRLLVDNLYLTKYRRDEG